MSTSPSKNIESYSPPFEITPFIKSLFSLHIQYNKITPELVRRSLSSYIRMLDPKKIYFLEAEVGPYLTSPNLWQAATNRVEQEDYSDFLALYRRMEMAVFRAWLMRPPSLREISPPSYPYFEQYARTPAEIKQRHSSPITRIETFNPWEQCDYGQTNPEKKSQEISIEPFDIGAIFARSLDPHTVLVRPVKNAEKRPAAQSFKKGSIGVIRLDHLSEEGPNLSTTQAVAGMIQKFREEQNFSGLVLDLRNNSGGRQAQLGEFLGLFLEKRVAAIVKEKNRAPFAICTSGSRVYKGPLIVLSSRKTASAAEVIIAALKHYQTAVIVGDERTFGKGTIQQCNKKQDYSAVMTTGRWYPPSGLSIQCEGVSADVVMPTGITAAQYGEKYLEYALDRDDVNPLEISVPEGFTFDPELKPFWKEDLELFRRSSQTYNQQTQEEDPVLQEAIHIANHWKGLKRKRLFKLVNETKPTLPPPCQGK